MKKSQNRSNLNGLAVTYLPVTKLKPAANNPRTHSKKQIKQVAKSIQEFGFTNPILIDDTKHVIAGHGRLLAAKLLNLESVPTIYLNHMTPEQKRAYVIADNKLAENAGWDESLLAMELEALTELDLDFDITLTGFEMAEIDILIDQQHHRAEPADVLPDLPPDTPIVSQLGDLWQVGDHRLLCGNATQQVNFDRLMAGKRAQLVFTDPPYNVPIKGHVCGTGKIQHDEFDMAVGEMSSLEFINFLTGIMHNLSKYSTDGSIHYICMDWRHMDELSVAGHRAYTELKNVCVWNKTNAGMGSLYRSKHELVYVFKSGTKPHINNIELGKYGRYRTNVWDYEGVNTFNPERREELALHPTVKPIAMVADAIKDCSKRKHIVLDCFAGSGTTLLAAEKTRRRGYGMELDPQYVDIALIRLKAQFGLDAIHEETGLDFNAIKRQRLKAKAPVKQKAKRKNAEVAHD